MAEIRTKIIYLLPMYVCNMYGIYLDTQGCIKLTLLTGEGENEVVRRKMEKNKEKMEQNTFLSKIVLIVPLFL